MWTVTGAVVASILTSYMTTKIIYKRLLKNLEEIEKKHREELLNIAREFIHKHQ